MVLLKVSGLQVATEGKEILRGVDVTVKTGEVVALMGPNGSGKSTLASVLMGHPGYAVTAGEVTYDGTDLLARKPEERAQAGMFLAFQYPQSVAGVTLGNFLRLAYNATHEPKLSIGEFLPLLKEKMKLLKLPSAFGQRPVNEGLSGGEKKRAEMLQLAVLAPRLAILDETDSGLDVDALRTVAEAIQAIRQSSPALSILLITHYQRILEYLPPDRVVIMREGRIIKEGDAQLLQYIDAHGYRSL
ncbi:MAG: Fe-S cluster assembly ATPase SufC [Candidatus Andersenbacteria bacterium]